jgi:hypothetical protein
MMSASSRALLMLALPLLLAVAIADRVAAAAAAAPAPAPAPWQPAQAPLTTPWTAQVTADNAWPEHPRPMMTRDEQSWQSLNGLWEIDYEATPDALDRPAPRATLPHQILVPFPLESALGGLRVQAPNYTTIYRRVFPSVLPQCGAGSRRLLHFEKVDWNTTVWVNGEKVCNHTGGYDPFTCPLPATASPTDAAVSKNGSFAPFIYKMRMFYQDRLGTNIGKTQKKGPSFLRRPWRSLSVCEKRPGCLL